jgi:TonB family protein
VFYARAHPHRETGADPDAIDLTLLWVHANEGESMPVEIVTRPQTSPTESPSSTVRRHDEVAARVVLPGSRIGPEPIAPEGPSVPNAPNPGLPPASPFMMWAPGQETHHAGAQALNGADLLAAADQDADHAAAHGALGHGGGDGPVDQPGGRAQALDASTGYVRRMLEDATPTQVPGSADYYRQVRVAAARVWHPTPVPAPTFLQGVVGTFIAPTSTSIEAARRSMGPFATSRAGAAAVDLDMAHPNSPMLVPRNTMAARADATAQTTHVEVEVDQDAAGQIVAMRVIRRSGVAGYDSAAMDAIRDAVRQIDPHEMPGGWRSRWEFAITMSRDPLISALPGLPGEAPAFGLTAEVSFDEVTGETDLHLPGRLHRRRMVRLISSHVIATQERHATTARAP